MSYLVKRTIANEDGTAVSYQNVFNRLEDAIEFYHGTTGALSVDLYDAGGSLMHSKGVNAAPIQIVRTTPVEKTSIEIVETVEIQK